MLHKNECGYVRLAYAILEQAVADVKMLQAGGFIVDGRVADPYPAQRGKTAKVCGYSKPHKAKELLLWFRNGAAAELLDMLESNIDAAAMCQRLGI